MHRIPTSKDLEEDNYFVIETALKQKQSAKISDFPISDMLFVEFWKFLI